MRAKPYTSEQLKALIPWYLNGSLPEEQKRALETWLASSSEARAEMETWLMIQASVHAQPRRLPSKNLRGKIIAHAIVSSDKRRVNSGEELIHALMLSLMVMIILWIMVRPGIVLNWTVQDGSPSGFRVYRALEGSENFKLVGEIPASATSGHYTYVDLMALPAEAYTYQVQGIGQSGLVTSSLPVSGSALNVFASQLAMVFTSLIFGYGLAHFTRRNIFSSSKEVLQG